MDKVKNCILDSLKAFGIGVGAGIAVGIAVALIRFLFPGRTLYAVVRAAEQAQFFIGAVGLFIGAALILKRDGGRKLTDQEGFKKHFKQLGFRGVLIALGAGILFCGGLLDYYLFYL